MYEIYKISNDLFQIHSTFSIESKEGTQLAILTYAAFDLGFKPDDLQAALLDMIEKDHDSAHFGLNRTFIYSFNRHAKYGRKTA